MPLTGEQLQDRVFGTTIAELVERSHALALSKGWYDTWPDTGKASTSSINVPEKLALIHSEVSEALEAFRAHGVRRRCPRCHGAGVEYVGKCVDCYGDGFFEAWQERANGITTAMLPADGSRPIGKPEGFVVELADAVIRIADLCGALGLDLAAAIETKHAFNQGRSFRHGGKNA